MLKTGIGLKISELISKNKATKTFVAKKLNITRQTLDDYINEKTSITIEKLYILADMFDYPIYNFFKDDNQKFTEKPDVDRVLKVLGEIIKERI